MKEMSTDYWSLDNGPCNALQPYLLLEQCHKFSEEEKIFSLKIVHVDESGLSTV
jgi:hypothetical protein